MHTTPPPHTYIIDIEYEFREFWNSYMMWQNLIAFKVVTFRLHLQYVPVDVVSE